MLLRRSTLRGRGRADDEGAMPLPRMPIYYRRLAQHVCPDVTGWLQLYQGNAQAICTQRSRKARDAGILCRMRHAFDHPANGRASRRFESRHVRRSQPVWWPADGDLHHRQAGFPSNPRWHAELRASAETMTRVQDIVGGAHNKSIRPDTVRRETARHDILLILSPAPEGFSNRPLLSGGR